MVAQTNYFITRKNYIPSNGSKSWHQESFLDTLLKYGAAKIYAKVWDVQQTKKTASSMIPGPWYNERIEPLHLGMREASSIAMQVFYVGLGLLRTIVLHNYNRKWM